MTDMDLAVEQAFQRFTAANRGNGIGAARYVAAQTPAERDLLARANGRFHNRQLDSALERSRRHLNELAR